MNRVVAPAALAAIAGVCLYAAPSAPRPIRGFSPKGAEALRALEQKARVLPEAGRVHEYIERMSGQPHAAGQPQSRAVADYVLGLLKQWGYDAQIEEFEALLPYPTERVLEMTAPVKFRAKLQEPAIAEDPDSADRGQLPTYNAYSASGDVTAPVAYVNYGVPEDYEQLAKLGIDVKGKVVIARYGKSWRGTKAKVAQEHGAAACLIYSDPRDDGYFQGDGYPKGPYRPADSVQRGSVLDMPLYAGDPLTPGWASEKGSRKLDRKDATALIRIPVLPISYADAQPMLANLDGPVAPEAWRGALPITYHVGSGPAIVHLKLDFDWTIKPVYNVIATIPGSRFPDQWVLYGNHHDAWVNGANDPVSGAAALLETARTLAELRKQGWQPKRTIRFALWDAEEFGLIGSTEWVEKHEKELAEKAVVYFNSDSNSKGEFSVGATPLLEAFLREVLRDCTDPVSGLSLIEASKARSGSKVPSESDPIISQDFTVGSLGAGSDYVAFYHHVGIASVNAGFSSSSSAGVYHSIYDSFRWYSKFEDPGFLYGKALAQLMATSILRMSEADVLPFEYESLMRTAVRWMDEIKKLKGGNAVRFDPLLDELQQFKAAAVAFEAELGHGRWQDAPEEKLGALNTVLYRSERALAPDTGLSARKWYKHLLAAPGTYTGYSAKTLPEIREAVEAANFDEANRQVGPVIDALRELRSRVERATLLLKELE